MTSVIITRAPENTGQMNTGTAKIALMFLTRGDHAHPGIWRAFLAGNSHHFKVYCHPYLAPADEDCGLDGTALIARTSFLCNRSVPGRAYTRWGHVANAYYALLSEAVKDVDIKRFVFLSDTCVPTKHPDQVYRALMQRLDVSFMDAPRPWEDLQRYRQKFEVDRQYFFKHSGWFALGREDAMFLARSKKWFSMLNAIPAGDEHILSLLRQVRPSALVHRPVTYVKWDYPRHDLFRSGRLHRAHRAERHPSRKEQLKQELERCREAFRHPASWETKVTTEDLRQLQKSE